MVGYFNHILQIFEQHNHPFVLVGDLGSRWNGANTSHRRTVDIRHGCCDLNTTPIEDVWLEYIGGGWLDPDGKIELKYLHFWPEALYQLSLASCLELQAPDVYANHTCLEDEYDRDPYHRFRPRLQEHDKPLLGCRARSAECSIPIYVPAIATHLDALLDQRRAERETQTSCGNQPEGHIWNIVRYNYLDYEPTRKWLVETKIAEHNKKDMWRFSAYFRCKRLILWDDVLGKAQFGVLPWELTVPGGEDGPSPEEKAKECMKRERMRGRKRPKWDEDEVWEEEDAKREGKKVKTAKEKMVEGLAMDFGLEG